jgi:hypothetical protein
MESHTCEQGQTMTLAAASLIEWVNFVHKLCFARPKGPCPMDISVANQYFFSQNRWRAGGGGGKKLGHTIFQ